MTLMDYFIYHWISYLLKILILFLRRNGSTWDIGRCFLIESLPLFFHHATILDRMQRHFQKHVKVSFWNLGFVYGSEDFSILGSTCFEDDICSKPERRGYHSRYVTLSFDLQQVHWICIACRCRPWDWRIFTPLTFWPIHASPLTPHRHHKSRNPSPPFSRTSEQMASYRSYRSK